MYFIGIGGEENWPLCYHETWWFEDYSDVDLEMGRWGTQGTKGNYSKLLLTSEMLIRRREVMINILRQSRIRTGTRQLGRSSSQFKSYSWFDDILTGLLHSCCCCGLPATVVQFDTRKFCWELQIRLTAEDLTAGIHKFLAKKLSRILFASLWNHCQFI